MDDITFGDVEEQRPEPNLRPDRNRHFAVVECGDIAEGDLPIFVDLDVLMDMESHALTDTSVELGGVMLGGQFEDDDGKPFVVVTDSLRAEHYEATKGSFKFTHETWQQISRERDEFPPELQMVGWYHTHPDWGVFLSGMDTFICDNFFNKPLDVALVIDPCRQDRGWFMWTGSGQERLKRTGGFYITASRYRAAELEECAAMLSGELPMRTATTTHAGPGAAPIVHEEKPGWMGTAVLGMLFSQLCVLVLVAVALLRPPTPAAENDELAKARKLVEELQQERAALRKESVEDKARIIEQIVPGLRDGQGSVIDRLTKAEREITLLEGAKEGFEKVREEKLKVESRLGEEATKVKSLKAERDEGRKSIAALEADVKRLKTDLKKATGEETDDPAAVPWWRSNYVLYGSIALVFLAILVALSLTYVKPPRSRDAEIADATDEEMKGRG